MVSNAITGQPLGQGVLAATAAGAVSGALVATGAGILAKAGSAVRAPAIATPRPVVPRPSAQIARPTARPVAPRSGFRVEHVGRQRPVNRSGNGHFGVRYSTRTASGNRRVRSFELHSPHRNRAASHQRWHWQRNSWNTRTNSSTPQRHWTI